MIGSTISHYKILEKPPTSSGQVGEGGMSENHPRLPAGLPAALFGGQAGALLASGCDFQDPRLPHKMHGGGQAPSFAFFASAGFLADWRRREQ